MKRKLLALLCVAAMLVSLLASCTPAGNDNGDATDCTHPLSETWSSDNKNHWKPTTCEHSEYRSEPEAHADANEDGKCDVCAYEVGHTHTFKTEWSSDDKNHWKAASCTHQDVRNEVALHQDDNTDAACDVCAHHVHIVDKSGFCTVCDEKVVDIEEDTAGGGSEEDDSTLGGNTGEEENTQGGGSGTEDEKPENPEPKPETDAERLEKILAAIMDRSPGKIVSGKVDYGVVIRGKTGNLEEGDAVEYTIFNDGTYTKRTETAARDGKTVITEVWMELVDAENEILNAILVESVDGQTTYAEPVSLGVDDLAGYYFAVSTLANEYGAEAILGALYELSKADTATEVTVSGDKEKRTFTFSYNILIINTDTAEGEDDGVDYYEVDVTFGYSEDYILTSLDIVCDCYTNSLADEAEHDYTYDQATKTIKMKETATADTYTFSVTQTSGTRTEIEMENAEQYIPNDVTIYEDSTHTKEASSVTVVLGTDPDAIPVFYVGCPEGTFISFVKSGATVSVDKVGLTASLVGETIQFYPSLAGTYVITLTFGTVSKSVTVVVEDVALAGDNTIEITVTDTYAWVDLYTFTAPESGTYTFHLPYGVGAWDEDSYDHFGQPWVDFQSMGYEGSGSFSVDIAKDDTYSFYVSAMTKGTYTVGYDFEAKEVIKDENEDDSVIVLPLKIGNNAINEEDAQYSYVADAKGTLTLKLGGVVSVGGGSGTVEVTYSLNDGAALSLAANSEVKLSLEAGDKVFINIVATAYSSLSAAWEGEAAEEEPKPEVGSGDGSEEHPFVVELPAEALAVEGNSETKLWYIFTTEEAGVLTVTYSGTNSWIEIWNVADGSDSDQGYKKQTYEFTLKANSTYRLGVGVWNKEEGVTVNLTFTAQ